MTQEPDRSGDDEGEVQSSTSSQMPLSLALFPVIALIAALSWNVYVYGDDALGGSSQMIIILITGLVAAIGLKRGVSWATQQKAVVATICLLYTSDAADE